MTMPKTFIFGQLFLIGPMCALWILSDHTFALGVCIAVFICYLFSLSRANYLYRLDTTATGAAPKPLIAFVALIIISLLSFVVYFNYLNPASAWDFITAGGWAEQGISLH
ncbi:MAG: hypothetical protein CML33_03390, partial [Rhodobacteraceae bacterium]|nr:hypothetical protein [Paracoccaceae bacterium]